MAFSISDVLAIIQNGVTAVNNLNIQLRGSLTSILASITTNAASIVALQQTTPSGRLTLQTATPVMTTTQSGKTTLYYTPYVGDNIPLWDGVQWVHTNFAELSALTTDATKSPAAIGVGKVNDWFVWNDNGTIRLGHGPDWTSDTARSAGTALLLFGGLYLNGVTITNGPAAGFGTYVGTTRSGVNTLEYIFGGTASGGVQAFLGVWNAYNRVSVPATSSDNGVPYTYSSGTVRQARASSNMQIVYVAGLAEDAVAASINARTNTLNVANSFSWMGIGFDSTTAFVVRAITYTATASINTDSMSLTYNFDAQIGAHVISMNEQSDGTNAATMNADGLNTLTALARM